jgi:hypothetical protein
VAQTLGAEGRLRLDHLLTADETTGHTLAKRYTFAAALVKAQVAQTLDDRGEMFLKRMRSIHHRRDGRSPEESAMRRSQQSGALVTATLLMAALIEVAGREAWADEIPLIREQMGFNESQECM